MVKSELIMRMAARFPSANEEQVENYVNRVFDYMTDTLKQNSRVEVRGFGSFCLHYRPPRNTHNPKTGQKFVSGEKYIPYFKPGKEMKERINASKDNIPLPPVGRDDKDDE